MSGAIDPARWPEVRRWVGELVEADEAERERRLAALPPEVAQQVRALLASDDPVLSERMVGAVGRRAAEWLAAATGGGPPEATASQNDLAGLRLGAWRLVRPLGRGGMAEVWEAQRAEGDYEHRAAVKLLKRGMDSEEVVARFRRERQILARLEHPAIARILDGGLAPDGRPYLVLEKVDGEPVNAWCSRTGADVPRRLGLLIEICEAVAAAHRQLVVHRDLKPSNILVGADGRIKLLDFGIAKLLDAGEDETRSEVRLLTPAYAAPEQILGEPISTATDVYAIGVLAYELLTGRLPHRRSAARAAELVAELTRESVARPSTAVLEAAGAAAVSVPGDRHRLARRLRGDLDAIVLTTLRRDPARRYASVDALAEDLRRTLDGRPVLARPDSMVYRARKFVGRHRVAAAAAAVAVVAVLGGLGAALWQADRAARAAAEATAKATEAEAIAEFLTEVFTTADPEGGAAADRTARDLVARGAEKVGTDLADQPATRAAMLHVLGGVQYRLAMLDSARELLGEALALRRSLVPPREADIAASAAALGMVEHRLGDSVAGAALLEEALALHERTFGAQSTRVASDLNNLANAYRVLGRVEEARASFERAIAILERDGGERARLARALNNYGLFLDRSGDDEAARRMLERALTLHEETSGPQSAIVVGTLGNLAMLYLSLGEPDRAEAAARRALATSTATYGPEHYESGMAENTVGWVLLRTGRPGEARPFLEQSIVHLAARLGPSHPTVGYSHRNLGEALAATGEPAAAIAAMRRAAAMWEAAWGADSHELVSVYRRLAPLLVATGKGAEGEEAERLAVRTVELRAEDAAGDRLEAWLELARIRTARCRLDAAREAVARAEVVASEAVDGAAANIATTRAEIEAAACVALAEK